MTKDGERIAELEAQVYESRKAFLWIVATLLEPFADEPLAVTYVRDKALEMYEDLS